MAMYDTNKIETSKNILDQVFKQFPDYDNYADLTLLHNLSFLKTVTLIKNHI